MNRKYKDYSKLEITDDFMFCKVMQNPEICKELLETLLDIHILEIHYPESQKVIEITSGAKGIQLDVYVDDEENSVYNIEMQSYKYKHLPKRTRYYQDLIDLNILERGMDYSQLPKSFIIFICNYDVIKRGRSVYTFETRCLEEPDVSLEDGIKKIIFNIEGSRDNISDELIALLDYFKTKQPTNEFTQKIQDAVEMVRSNGKWRREYMIYQSKFDEMKEIIMEEALQEGLQEGRQQGLQQGLQEGRQEGLQQGLQEGRQEGLQQGLQEGLQQGLQQGLQEGLQQGQLKNMIELYLEKIIDLNIAITKLELSEDDFLKKVEDYKLTLSNKKSD